MPVGPDVAPGAGSLVAYSLGISILTPSNTTCCSEALPNQERVSMPDFDIDFCQDGRDRVIDYVRKINGEESVSQSPMLWHHGGKAAVRDAAACLTCPTPLSTASPNHPVRARASGHTGAGAGRPESQHHLRQGGGATARGPRAQRGGSGRAALTSRRKLEGLLRNVGMHAGGVLIAPGKLTDFCPLYFAGRRFCDGEPVRQG